MLIDLDILFKCIPKYDKCIKKKMKKTIEIYFYG